MEARGHLGDARRVAGRVQAAGADAGDDVDARRRAVVGAVAGLGRRRSHKYIFFLVVIPIFMIRVLAAAVVLVATNLDDIVAWPIVAQ